MSKIDLTNEQVKDLLKPWYESGYTAESLIEYFSSENIELNWLPYKEAILNYLKPEPKLPPIPGVVTNEVPEQEVKTECPVVKEVAETIVETAQKVADVAVEASQLFAESANKTDFGVEASVAEFKEEALVEENTTPVEASENILPDIKIGIDIPAPNSTFKARTCCVCGRDVNVKGKEKSLCKDKKCNGYSPEIKNKMKNEEFVEIWSSRNIKNDDLEESAKEEASEIVEQEEKTENEVVETTKKDKKEISKDKGDTWKAPFTIKVYGFTLITPPELASQEITKEQVIQILQDNDFMEFDKSYLEDKKIDFKFREDLNILLPTLVGSKKGV